MSLICNKMKAYLTGKIGFRKKEVTGMCTTEPKEPLPLPEAFRSFGIDKIKNQKSER